MNLAFQEAAEDFVCPQTVRLTDKNILVEAYKIYRENNPRLGVDDFREDFMRFMYVAKLVKIYKTRQKLNTRLLLNHMVILYNVFGAFATRVLFIKSDDEIYPEMAALVKYFSRDPISGIVNLLDLEMVNIRKYENKSTIVQQIEESLKP